MTKRLGAVSDDLLAALEAIRAERGLRSVSEALRLVVQEAKMGESRAELADRDEVLKLATDRARAGHVPAMALLLAEFRRQEVQASGDSIIEELAKRRRGH